MKFIEIVKKWAWQILTVTFFVLYLGQGCTNNNITRMNRNLSIKVDSLSNVVNSKQITKEELKDLNEEMMWKFLEYEEMSDKDKIPINKLKSDHASK